MSGGSILDEGMLPKEFPSVACETPPKIFCWKNSFKSPRGKFSTQLDFFLQLKIFDLDLIFCFLYKLLEVDVDEIQI